MILSGLQRSHKTKAEAARRKGDRKKAIELYEKALDKDPSDLKVRKELAALYAEEGETARAIAQFEAVAGAYAAAGLLLRAISACKTILELDPGHTQTQKTLAALYAKKRGPAGMGQGRLPQSMSAALLPRARAQSGPPAAGFDVIDADDIVAEQSDVFEDADPETTMEVDDGDLIGIPTSAPPTLPPHAISTPPVPASDDGDPLDDDEGVDAALLDDDEGVLSTQEIDLEGSDILILEVATDDAYQTAEITVGGLPASPLFSDLPTHAFEELVPALSTVRAAKGAHIVTQGDYGKSFFVIVTGTARVEREEDGATQTLGRLLPGEFFGEIALLGRSQRSASVIAESDIELFEITRPTVDAVAGNYPSVKRVLNRFCSERLLSNMVRTSPVFSDLDEEIQRDAVRAFRKKDVRLGETILRQGEHPKGLYVILSGEVDVSVQRDDGSIETLNQLAEGDVFGEMGLFLNQPAMATVTALKNCTLLRLSRRMFERFCTRHPSVRARILDVSRARAEENRRQGLSMRSLPPV